jgi:hypothetical protein
LLQLFATGVIGTGGKFATVLLILAVNLDLRIFGNFILVYTKYALSGLLKNMRSHMKAANLPPYLNKIHPITFNSNKSNRCCHKYAVSWV